MFVIFFILFDHKEICYDQVQRQTRKVDSMIIQTTFKSLKKNITLQHGYLLE